LHGFPRAAAGDLGREAKKVNPTGHPSDEEVSIPTFQPISAMKLVLPITLGLGLMTGRAAADAQEKHRTDINPALLYWQAIVLTPVLADADRSYLLTNEFQGGPLNERLRSLTGFYNVSYRVIEQAALQTPACDWGYDVTYGPMMLLPGLAKAKHFAVVERVRFRSQLEDNNAGGAVREWLATRAFGHRLATDGTLISRLVQIAMDNIQLNTVAENWFRLDAEALRALQQGLETSPKAGTVAELFEKERTVMRDWFIGKIEAIVNSTSDPEQRRQKALTLFGEIASEGDQQTPEKFLEAAGGNVDNMVTLLRQLDPLYVEAAELLRQPYDEFQKHVSDFEAALKNNANPFVNLVFPSIQRARLREFTAECRAAMLRAALARRLEGEAGFNAVADPLTGKPFEVRPVEVAGKKRGFQLRSGRYASDPMLAQIFLESDGAPLHLDGPNAGSAY
jgi:hypothetical protein